jgi:uncharacterized protein (TIGR02145 family)
MKRFITICAALLTAITMVAQTPEKMSYQAVVRDADDNLLTNQTIGIQISILQGSANGTAVYVETHLPSTNANGLITLEIGTGSTSDDFSSIDWANGPYFIKTETDVNGGSNYTITGTSQLLSVPFALHAKTAETVTGGISETDPVFGAWDKSTGISITESQISDFGLYIETELDPEFISWDKSTGILISKSQITDLGTIIETESDPVFSGWDKTTGIVITESQISDLGSYIATESDPLFGSWDKSTGISITKSQITDLGTIVETESDPIFSNWDKSTGISITESQILDLGTYLDSESDPLFTSWDKSSGVTITESQITDLGSYIETEVDPLFAGWDKSSGISISESQITDLQSYLTSESDPEFTSWDKTTGISITESQISDLGTYLETETDPVFDAKFDMTGVLSGDLLKYDGSKFVKFTPTYISDYTVTESDVTAHQAALEVTESQITDLQSYLTAESDPEFTSWDKTTGISITESQISDLGAYIETETDPSVPAGTQVGEMQYWNGTEWVTVPAGQNGQTLTFYNGSPVWAGSSLEDGVVLNTITGRYWMDRNLGASQVATSSTDAASYGDLYQWGRGTDGHEKRTSGTTSTLSTTDTPGHGDFITDSNPTDWRSPRNDNLWQGVDGINNPCPSGYRVPTKAEWEAEYQTWVSEDAVGAFASVLKLPLAGTRTYSGGIGFEGLMGYYWTSTTGSLNSRIFLIKNISLNISTTSRISGNSVRCIKD